MKAQKYKKDFCQEKKMKNKSTYLIILSIVAALFGSSRVAYTRPGEMIKIPTSSSMPTQKLFTVGASTQIYKSSPLNQGTGVFLKAFLSPKFQLGLSSISFADTSTYINNEPGEDTTERFS